MSFTLTAGDHILNGRSALIKASDRAAFAEAHALLAETSRIKGDMLDRSAAARDEAYREGLTKGYEQVQGYFLSKLDEMSAALAQHEQERRASIADAAMAAVRMMIGDLGAGDIVPGLAERALDRMGEDSRYSVEVAPDHVEAVATRLAGREGVAVEANPALGPLDCVVRTSTGRVIANLDTQIETLAQRWGVGEAAPSDIATVGNGNLPA